MTARTTGLLFFLCITLGGCGAGPARCVPGSTQQCFCAGGAIGVQSCEAAEIFGACSCEGTGTDAGVTLDAQASCASVTCDSPPAAECVDAETLRRYASRGSCADDVCSYPQTDVVCADACADGACVGEPCAGLACDAPPEPECMDATTLERFEGGRCEDGACVYTAREVACAFGCSDGACVDDPFTFTPSNGVRWMDGADASLTLTLSGEYCTIDARSGEISCDDRLLRRAGAPQGVEDGIGWEIVDPVSPSCSGTTTPAQPIGVFSIGRLVVSEGTTVGVYPDQDGTAIVAREIVVHGLLDAWVHAGDGPAPGRSVTTDASGTPLTAAGGAGGATRGGDGAGSPGSGGAAVPPQFEPLCGGSGGGAGSAGAGALLLVASERIEVTGSSGCGVTAVGRGRYHHNDWAVGGSSGGTISLEAPEIEVSAPCVISAAGGGGGGGSVPGGESGESGGYGSLAGAGAGGPGPGGSGGRGGDALPPTSGQLSGAGLGGAGGGAAGFIRVRTSTCPTSLPAIPAASCESL